MDPLRHRRVIRAVMTQSILVPVGDGRLRAARAHDEGAAASSGASTGSARPPPPRARGSGAAGIRGADSAAAGDGVPRRCDNVHRNKRHIPSHSDAHGTSHLLSRSLRPARLALSLLFPPARALDAEATKFD